MGSDVLVLDCFHDVEVISIRAPRVGSDQAVDAKLDKLIEFQSALPVWGATWTVRLTAAWFQFQSALPVRGATMTPVPTGLMP